MQLALDRVVALMYCLFAERERDEDPLGRDEDPHGRVEDPHGRDGDPRGRGEDPHGQDEDPHPRDKDLHWIRIRSSLFSYDCFSFKASLQPPTTPV